MTDALAAPVRPMPSEMEHGNSGRARPKPTLVFYGSAEWKSLIREIIARRGRQCEDPACKTPNRARGKRVYGDHIVELKDGGAPLEEANIMLRCASCHSTKTHALARHRNL
jgi:5-methylcytosine-specific restriction protein A